MTDNQSNPWGDPAFEQAVRDTAYFLWEHAGRPQGREQEYWYAALEKCMLQREADKSLQQSLKYDDVQHFGDASAHSRVNGGNQKTSNNPA